ncbi:hypothetical protein MYAM1_001991 [Malassezia yamatoensis]|uniref:FAD dependent oxidoreductase domain-containing protein n=1 Tax=Malassezia yamatoensis TaxID=253288 RepID=A0AAJ5YX64_9BASI|nr:hypothetical protein MYAM1_001991 [Malassezia yamatoensis]
MSSFTHVLIVGGGAFGASTAVELARLGHRVTVLEKSADGNAADNAASNDLNKIIRADYDKSIHHWRTNPVLKDFYHETGVIFRSGMNMGKHAEWIETSIKNAMAPVSNMKENVDQEKLPKAYAVTNGEQAVNVFPPALRPHLGDPFKQFREQIGYFNPHGGWAEAKNATFAVMDEARRLGAEVVTNARVTKLIYAEPKYNQTKPKVIGVETHDGRTFLADRVLLTTGCWTASMLEQLKLPMPREILKPTAHCVLTLQLNPEVAEKFRGTPVTFNMYTGFYTFEPNADGILKCAIHGKGSSEFNPGQYPGTEYPKVSSDEQAKIMIKELQSMFPILQLDGPKKTASVLFTRMCWYSDSADENFLIDFHPDVDDLLVASGDSGHGFKFLPLLGRLVAARLLHLETGTDELVPDFGLSSYQRRVFSFAHHLEINDPKNPNRVSTDSIRIGAEAIAPAEFLQQGPSNSKL